MEKVNNEEKIEGSKDAVPHSFSYDGYEVLYDEEMDKISVSVLYSDCDEISMKNSQTNLATTIETHEKKMKISLSQEQLKLNLSSKNLLSVPTTNSRKIRSPSISSAIEPEVSRNIQVTQSVTTFSENYNEVVYAVPRRFVMTGKNVMAEKNEIITSSASLSPWKSVTVGQTSSKVQLDKNFKYPLSFYCNICNNILNDPRTLDCLHSFCMQCLSRLDATNDLQNNQFWRKISERSDTSCKLRLPLQTRNLNLT